MIRDHVFESQITGTGPAYHVRLSGVLDEHAKMPELIKANKVTLNLAGISMITSVGTRTWLGWVGRFRTPAAVFLEECAVAMVRHFSTVKGFLPPSATVQSFYIPFYSDETGERRDVLALRGRNFFADGRLVIDAPKDQRGRLMEMDVVPETYLGFLRA